MSFDNKDMVDQAIVNFKDIKSKRAEKAAEQDVVPALERVMIEEPVEEELSKDDRRKLMATKMDSAKLYGNREIKQFKEAVDEFISKVENMALFGDLSEVAKALFLEQILEGYMEPVFKGQCPYGIPESMFKKLRADMFKTLIKQYVDGEGKK